MCALAEMTAPQHTEAPASSTSGPGMLAGARDRGPNKDGLPSTAPSWIVHPSPITVPAWMTT